MSAYFPILFRLAEVHGQAYARAVMGIIPNLPHVPWGYLPDNDHYYLWDKMSSEDAGRPVNAEFPEIRFSYNMWRGWLATADINALKVKLDQAGIDLLPDTSTHEKLNLKDCRSLDSLLKNSTSPLTIGFYSTVRGNKVPWNMYSDEEYQSIPGFRITLQQTLELLDAHNYVVLRHEVSEIRDGEPEFMTPSDIVNSMRVFQELFLRTNDFSSAKALCVKIARNV